MALRARKRRRLIDVFFCGAQKEEQCHATGSESQMNAHARPHRDHCPLYSSANPPVSVAAPAEGYMKRDSFCTNAIVAKAFPGSRESFATVRWACDGCSSCLWWSHATQPAGNPPQLPGLIYARPVQARARSWTGRARPESAHFTTGSTPTRSVAIGKWQGEHSSGRSLTCI